MRAFSFALSIVLFLSACPAWASVTDELRMGKIPVYPGARPQTFKNAQAIATVHASLGKVLAFYRKTLPRHGWHAAIPDDLLNQDLDRVPLALLLYERGTDHLRIVVASRKGKTMLWWEETHGQSTR